MTSKPPYHSRYSEETLSLIEKCITDLKLTTLQKKAILDDLKKGKPIPSMMAVSKIQPTFSRNKKIASFSLKRAKKRKMETMIQCGAYDIPVYVPDKRTIDRDKEKQRLQDIFYGLDRIPEDEIEQVGVSQETSPKPFEYERMDELMNEIEDRLQFLRSMDELGLKKKYNFEISNEIAQKLKQLDELCKRVEKTKV